MYYREFDLLWGICMYVGFVYIFVQIFGQGQRAIAQGQGEGLSGEMVRGERVFENFLQGWGSEVV